MKISLTRLTNKQHRLTIERDDGSRDAATLETRSYLLHDLLHLAVETEANVGNGFWGCLARGKTLADMNDRSGASMSEYADDMAAIEQIVGVLTGAAKGDRAGNVMAGLRLWLEAQRRQPPAWLSETFIVNVQARMHNLLGYWAATRHGETMSLSWPPS